MQSCADEYFSIVVHVQSRVWKSQVNYYAEVPYFWILRILHSSTTMHSAAALVVEFLAVASRQCCSDPGCTPVLVRAAGSQSAEELAAHGSDFRQNLTMIAYSKTSNVEIECNFARAT